MVVVAAVRRRDRSPGARRRGRPDASRVGPGRRASAAARARTWRSCASPCPGRSAPGSTSPRALRRRSALACVAARERARAVRRSLGAGDARGATIRRHSAREVLRARAAGAVGPGAVVFFTGLSGSGKSTIARALARRARRRRAERRHRCSTATRSASTCRAGLGFDAAAREINIDRIGWVAVAGRRPRRHRHRGADRPVRRGAPQRAGHGGAPTAPSCSCRVARRSRCARRATARASTPRHGAARSPDFTGISSPYEPPARRRRRHRHQHRAVGAGRRDGDGRRRRSAALRAPLTTAAARVRSDSLDSVLSGPCWDRGEHTARGVVVRRSAGGGGLLAQRLELLHRRRAAAHARSRVRARGSSSVTPAASRRPAAPPGRAPSGGPRPRPARCRPPCGRDRRRHLDGLRDRLGCVTHRAR